MLASNAIRALTLTFWVLGLTVIHATTARIRAGIDTELITQQEHFDGI
jgi:hypothetical protein